MKLGILVAIPVNGPHTGVMADAPKDTGPIVIEKSILKAIFGVVLVAFTAGAALALGKVAGLIGAGAGPIHLGSGAAGGGAGTGAGASATTPLSQLPGKAVPAATPVAKSASAAVGPLATPGVLERRFGAS